MKAFIATLIMALGYLGLAAPANAAIAPAPLPPASTCGTATDSTAALNSYLNAIPNNAQNNGSITLPANSCWNVDGTVTLQSKSGITYDFNGSTFRQSTSPTTGFQPILQLWLDSHVTFKNLSINGAYDGTNPNEGYYGTLFEADTNVAMIDVNESNIQGDFLYMSPPYDVDNTSDALNKNMWWSNSTFNNAGYHGLTVESVDGFQFLANNLSNISEDGMDFEYDDDSTGFNADGTPFWAAQDNVNIQGNTWTNLNGSDWYASIQGQAPGVQQHNISLIGNTINDNAPLFEIVGTDYGVTTAPYENVGLKIIGNKMGPGFVAKPYRGGSSATSSIYSVAALDMENNSFPVATADGTPSIYAMELYEGSWDTIKNNDFSGAIDIIQPLGFDLQNKFMNVNGNKIGAQ